jgi:hypothetical protein
VDFTQQVAIFGIIFASQFSSLNSIFFNLI